MSQATGHSTVESIGEQLLHSRLLQLVLGGLGLVVLAAIIDTMLVTPATTETWGIWAAILPVWGGALILTGFVGYSALWWVRH